MINKQIYVELSSIYNESHRHYHNMKHVNQCLGELEEYIAANGLLLKRELEHAIWFHDVIYNPYSKLNEENSVKLFESYAKSLDLSLNEKLVCDLIIGTKHHNVIDEKAKLEHDILNDIDFSILGATNMEYRSYCEKIRTEYSHVSYDMFNENRLAFLKTLAASPRIFQTDHYFQKYEKRARHNIMSEINYLNKVVTI